MSNGKSFFADLLMPPDQPIQREMKYGGATKTVYVRRISASERLALTGSQKFVVGNGEKPMVELSLQDIARKNQQLVMFAIVGPDGKKLFRNLDAVQELDAQLIDALVKIAEEVNREVEDEGKA